VSEGLLRGVLWKCEWRGGFVFFFFFLRGLLLGFGACGGIGRVGVSGCRNPVAVGPCCEGLGGFCLLRLDSLAVAVVVPLRCR
jgi:hypothetical protein